MQRSSLNEYEHQLCLE